METVSFDFFDGMPPELIAFMVGYIPAWQRAALRCTNKRICEIVDDMPNRRKSFLTHRSFALPFSTPEYLQWLEDTRPGKVNWREVSVLVGHYFPQPFAVYTEAYRLLLGLQSTACGVSQSGNCTVLRTYLQEDGVDNNYCLSMAAGAGKLKAMRLAVEMGATNFNSALCEAAESCQLEAMRLIVEMGATDFNRALYWAAAEGKLEAMRLVGKMVGKMGAEICATSFNGALCVSAAAGQLDAMRLAVEMGATNFNGALKMATVWGQTEAVYLTVEMGATDFNGALANAIRQGHLEAIAYMRKLIAERD
jgi:hypothetical protein